MGLSQALLKQPGSLRGFGGLAHDGGKVALVVKLRRRNGLHLAVLHKPLGVVVGQKAQKVAREDESSHRLLVERGRTALQSLTVADFHVG